MPIRADASVAIGSDHAGFTLKSILVEELSQRGICIIDVGTHSPVQIDYPPFCIEVGEKVSSGEVLWGVVLGGSGQGEMMAANKVMGVRAALCNDPYYARLARQCNDANVLALGARIVAAEFALEIIDVWMSTPFEGGRHKRRIDLISDYDYRRR